MMELAPSILSADLACLGAQALAALEGGGTVLHVDVMDGHFVPNITIGPPVTTGRIHSRFCHGRRRLDLRSPGVHLDRTLSWNPPLRPQSNPFRFSPPGRGTSTGEGGDGVSLR